MMLSVSVSMLLGWLSHAGLPLPRPGHPVLLFGEGLVPHLDITAGGRRWPSSAPGPLGDIWEGVGEERIALAEVYNAIDEFNDVGLLLWVADDGQVHLGVFYGSCNPGSVLSRRSGWPQLGDGAHLYLRSRRNDSGQPCLRSSQNRCLRELPAGETGGDGRLTLPEVVQRGMAPNPSVLVHPGRRATASAGCPLTSGTYEDAAWRGLWGAVGEEGIWVILHAGADLLGWLLAGGPAHTPPLLRPGCNALRWVAPLQRALGVPADGVYGPQTASALLAHRQRRGLTGPALEDARVAPAEWLALTKT